HGLDAAFLKRWIDMLALETLSAAVDAKKPGRTVPAVPLDLLEEKVARADGRPAINGWHRRGADLPVVISNSSDTTLQVPGKVPPHRVAVHPTPSEFVAVTWTSPVAGSVRVAARIAHAHPACGNGVAWWLEHRRGGRAGVLADGVLDLGAMASPPARVVEIEKG